MPRINVINSMEQMPAEHQHVADGVLGVFGRIRGPFSVLLHSPGLAERLLPMVPFAREATVVEGPLRLHAILAAVRERESAYVWSAQAAAARREGMPEATIDILRAKGDVSGLGQDERDVVNLIRQLMRTNRAEYPAFNRLLVRHGAQWMVELVSIAHYYAMLCGITNAFEVAVPEDGDQLP